MSTEHENRPTGAEGPDGPGTDRTAQFPAAASAPAGPPPPPYAPQPYQQPAGAPDAGTPAAGTPAAGAPAAGGPTGEYPAAGYPAPEAGQGHGHTAGPAPAAPGSPGSVYGQAPAPVPTGPYASPQPPADAGAGHAAPPPTAAFPGWPQAPGHGGGRRRTRGGLVAVIAAAALVAGALGGGIGYLAADTSDSGSGGSTTVSSSADPAALNRKPDSVAGIASKALPSVVTIKAEGGQESGTGTGFVYDKEGHILTNNHVVAPAANGGTLTVTFSDGKDYKASVVGRAEGYDVAVIKLDSPGSAKLVPLTLGNSDEVTVGDATIAIGAPFGLSGTVTTGIVSAKNRPVAAGGENGSQPSYMSAVQTDASINPGNSGGPLLDASGRVIGINSAIQSADSGGSDPFGGGGQAGSVGLGFAIPINQAKWVAETLIDTGEPVYSVLGILRNDEYNGKGAQISPNAIDGTPAITPGGAAEKAGLKPGDVITKLDDTLIENGPQLVSEIWTHKPGDKVEITYERGGKTDTVTVTLGERKGDNV